jgi:hypothetical protein
MGLEIIPQLLYKSDQFEVYFKPDHRF